jgi:uncharacterized protein (TIGR02246 family)
MKVFLVAIASLLLIACAGLQAQAPGIADEVRAAIAAIDKKFMADVNRGDAAAGAAAYTDDAILMPPNQSPIEGKQAIEKYLAELSSQLQSSDFQLSISEVDVQGDTAIVRGTYSSNITVPGMDAPIDDRGKTLNVWKKQADGSWKLHRDIWNSNMPVPGLHQMGKEEE